MIHAGRVAACARACACACIAVDSCCRVADNMADSETVWLVHCPPSWITSAGLLQPPGMHVSHHISLQVCILFFSELPPTSAQAAGRVLSSAD